VEVSGELHVPAALTSAEKAQRYLLDLRLGGPQNLSRRRRKENVLGPIGTRTPTLR
jgi:hypothetical protein